MGTMGSAETHAEPTPAAPEAAAQPAATEPLAREADAQAGPATNPAQATRVEPRAVRAQPKNAPLDVGNLFWKVLWSRLRGLFSFASR